MGKQKVSRTEHFATLPTREFLSWAMERVAAHEDYCKTSGRAQLIKKAHALTLGADIENGAVAWAVTSGGEQGETLVSMENHFHSIGNNVVNRVTAQRPAIQCGAANSDKRSLAQTMLGDGLVDLHLSEKELELLLRRAARKAWFTSEGFVEWGWDVHAGDEAGPNPESLDGWLDHQFAEEPQEGEAPAVTIDRKGEPRHWCLGPLDVIRDEFATSYESLKWRITVKWESKFELATRYREKAGLIVQLSTRDARNSRLSWGRREADTDLIPLYTFYHERTAAIPNGRMVMFLADDIELFDGALPFRRSPLARITPEELEDSPFGWTPMFDLMGPQDCVSGIDSAIITNQLGRGIGNMLVPRNANISIEAMSSSMNEVQYDGQQKPEPMSWPETPADLRESKPDKIAAMETLAGTNSVWRGNPSANIGADASGAKLALISDTAAINQSGFEKSWVDLNRDVALHGVIHLYRDFGGNVERLARIAGKANNYLVREFVADDLTDIDRVKVDIGNPVMRTTAGKMAVADRAVELGLIAKGSADSLRKYIHILKEGTAEPFFEVEQARLMRIRGENERLMDGGSHNALLTDPHWLEIPEHLSLLDNPELREPTPDNQATQANILGAVQQHIQLFTQMPPHLVMMLGGPEALAMWELVQGVPAMAPQQTGPGGPPPKQLPAGPGAQNTLNPAGSKPEMPGQPRMPRNPSTGEPPVMEGTLQ